MGFFRKITSALVDTGEADAPVDAAALEQELAAIRKAGGMLPAAPASGTVAPTPAPVAPAPAPVAGSTTITEGTPFSELYAKASVKPAVYTAEMLLQVLDRLKALPKDQVATMVAAMDEADDRWTVAEVLEDATQKRTALQAYTAALSSALAAAQASTNAAILAADDSFQEITKEVRAQIAELEKTLAEAKTATDAEKVAMTEQLAATSAAHTRETTRVTAEYERMGRILTSLK